MSSKCEGCQNYKGKKNKRCAVFKEGYNSISDTNFTKKDGSCRAFKNPAEYFKMERDIDNYRRRMSGYEH